MRKCCDRQADSVEADGKQERDKPKEIQGTNDATR